MSSKGRQRRRRWCDAVVEAPVEYRQLVGALSPSSSQAAMGVLLPVLYKFDSNLHKNIASSDIAMFKTPLPLFASLAGLQPENKQEC